MRKLYLTKVVFLPLSLALFFSSSCASMNVSHSEKAMVNGGTIKTSIEADLLVYAASPSGVLAGVAAAREGLSVVIVEPTHTIGGLLASGFRMQQDVPDPQHLGGLTREFYDRDIALHKGIHAPTLRHYQGAGEDNVAMLQEYIDQYDDLITVIPNHRLASVKTENNKITDAVFEFAPSDEMGVPAPQRASNNLTNVKAKMFIDASYEGDLMAYSGVSYRVGRESRDEYGESLAGVVVSRSFPGVDPYRVAGDPESGLLSPIFPGPIGEDGESSRFFMAWNFKLAWEVNPTKEYPGVPIGPPENRDDDVYELLKRYKEAGYATTWPHSNFNRRQLMTGSIPGMQTDYPDGDWETRSRIWQGFIDHVKTLTDFSGKDVRLLSRYREETGGWPFLYMRVGRRMIGEYVMTQQDIQLQTDVPTPIGMGYYKVDIYPARLAVNDEGVLVQEGDVFLLASPGPYQIPYGAIIPKREEIQNLLNPMMMSASHVAYSSIRMESTYMAMGESSGIAAALAIKSNKAVQDIDREELTSMLKDYGQELEWDGTGFYTKELWRSNIFWSNTRKITGRWETHPEEYSRHPVQELWNLGIDPEALEGIVMDNPEAEIQGSWLESKSLAGFIGKNYLHDNDEGKGDLHVRYQVPLPAPGVYEVLISYTADRGRAGNVPVSVESADGTKVVKIDQRTTPPIDNTFVSLGEFKFDAAAIITISNTNTTGYVIADAVQLKAIER